MADPQLQGFVDSVVARRDALAAASAANEDAQGAAQTAATAAAALQAKTTAHDELVIAIDALVNYVNTLK